MLTDVDRLVEPAASTEQSGQVAEHHRIDVGPPQRFVDGKGLLIGGDRPVVVAHRLVHGGDGVQDARLVTGVIGRPVHLQRSQTVVERGSEVARLVVDDGQQVQRPGQCHAELVRCELIRPRQHDRFRCEGEHVLALGAVVREQGQLVQRLCFERRELAGASHDPRLEDELLRTLRIGGTQTRRIVEHLAHLPHVDAQLLDRHTPAIMTPPRPDRQVQSPIQTRS